MYMELLAETADSAKTFLPLVDINASTIVFTLINTLIIFLLYRFLLHNKVMAMMDKRREAINVEIDAAENAKKQAEEAKAEYAEKLRQSKDEADKIVSDAVKRASDKEAEIIADANASAARMKQQAQESIEQEKRRALNEVKDQISEVVVLAASKVCEKEITQKDNADLIDSFLADVGSKAGNEG
ncbi:MAG TPA: ATP synthase F0 subunit B [Ruminococcaceae bacterium]|nr:ATP synthase F0 subunit B [Oscillospiraceae bacterium]